MLGLMQNRPLMISSLIEHAANFHADREVVSWQPEGGIHRTSYGQLRRRARQVANALQKLSVQPGDRVATLAWNTSRHLALYYGVPGIGAVLHPVNPLLFPEQIEQIVNRAADKVLFFDVCFSDLVQRLAPALKSVETFVAMIDRAHMPAIDVPNLLCYDELLDSQSADYRWPVFDENTAAAMYYTPGTTGTPKGVVCSHRAIVLGALVQLGEDTFGIHSADTVLANVPMFHAGSWGLPYCAAMVGARLVLSAPRLDGKRLYELLRDEQVTFTQATPAIWSLLFEYLDTNPDLDTSPISLTRVSSGGAVLSRAAIERLQHDFGAQVRQVWGMTETGAVGVAGKLLPKHLVLSEGEQTAIRMKQGRGLWGVELKIVGEDGESLPWDGQCFGQLYVRGPWIAGSYYPNAPGSALDADGWLQTGDVASIDPDGYLQLVDRSRDMIKSGGEWIPSIDLETAASTHPAVAEAAIIGVPHPKWQERPLLIVVKRPGANVTTADLIDHLVSRVPKWWLPDDVVFLDQLPRTATGKLMKATLRERYRAHLLP